MFAAEQDNGLQCCGPVALMLICLPGDAAGGGRGGELHGPGGRGGDSAFGNLGLAIILLYAMAARRPMRRQSQCLHRRCSRMHLSEDQRLENRLVSWAKRRAGTAALNLSARAHSCDLSKARSCFQRGPASTDAHGLLEPIFVMTAPCQHGLKSESNTHRRTRRQAHAPAGNEILR